MIERLVKMFQDFTKNKSYEQLWIQGVSIAIGFIGIINIFSAWFSFNPLRHQILTRVFEYQIIIGSRFLIVLTGFIALLIAPALYRQKRVAWYFAVLILAFSGLAHIFKGIDIEEASLSILLLGILLPLFRYCKVKSDPITVKQGWKLLAFSLIFVFAYTLIGLRIFYYQLTITEDFTIWQIVLNALQFDLSMVVPQTTEAKFFINSLFAVNSFAIILGIILFLMPVIARYYPDPNIITIKKLAKEYSFLPVEHFICTNNYLHYLYEKADQKSFIGYKVLNNVALAIGLPCGKAMSKEVISSWIEDVKEHDWLPAVYQVTEELLPVYKEYGFDAIPIGVEAVVYLENFTLEGKAMQQLRTAKNKAQKSGWIIKNYEEKYWPQVNMLNKNWVSQHGESEIDFAMGKATPEYLLETRTTLIFDQDEKLLAFLNNIELPSRNGRAVDLMRRDTKAPSGAMEALFIHELFQAKEENKTVYDLGFSPLAELDHGVIDNKLAVNFLSLIYEKQKKYYDFQGLHNFKAKFLPVWEKSYLVYPGQINLPGVLLALLVLNKGSNLKSWMPFHRS